MSHQYSDGPIEGTADSPDLLNRESFAQRIANALISINLNSGLVLSIEGPWGSGKTSLLNLIEKELVRSKGDNSPMVWRFNPWIIGSADTLVQSFLVQFAAAVGFADHVRNGKKAAKELLGYSSVFTALKFIPGAEPWATMVKEVFEAVGTATEKISGLKQLDIEEKKNAVVSSIKKLRRKIIVFVDDVDRLPPEEVFSMVRLVKAIGDFPEVCYVLSYDPAYIQEALQAHYIKGAQEYLDKVVQIRLTIPKMSLDDLGRILDAEFKALPSEAKKITFQIRNYDTASSTSVAFAIYWKLHGISSDFSTASVSRSRDAAAR